MYYVSQRPQSLHSSLAGRRAPRRSPLDFRRASNGEGGEDARIICDRKVLFDFNTLYLSAKVDFFERRPSFVKKNYDLGRVFPVLREITCPIVKIKHFKEGLIGKVE